MKISVIVENTSSCGLPVEHGLCLWIEACGRKFFFDLGQSGLFADNAKMMGIDVNEAEYVIVSHGHYDHGGGIFTFLSINNHTPIILESRAFTDCYSIKNGKTKYIGLNKDLLNSDRLYYTSDDVSILSEGLILFSGCKGHNFFSPANRRILKLIDGKMVCDDFLHEQSLIILDGKHRVLIAGCAHSGILNIMAKAEEIIGQPLTDVVSGMHLAGVEDADFIKGFASELKKHNCHYHTCHCTGEEAYLSLKEVLCNSIDYIRCGDVLII